ncbi:MAG TPA: rod shape-determining protein MreC [Chryseosolibacter sp.]
MERLFLFFYQYRAFFTFLVVEVICAWLIIENNQYQSAKFFNSSNGMVASLNSFSQDVREYFMLRNINSTLAQENAELRSRLEQFNQLQQASDSITRADSTVIKQFDFISAKVVNNSVNRFTNYLTINKGSDAGIKPGMAVISPLGAVGKVKAVSDHYSVVTSILHKDYRLSVLMTRTGYFGSVSWDGKYPEFAQLNFVPRHVNPAKGDTVVTSAYNAVFPEGIMVGVIEEVKQNETLFYDLTLRLSQDFRKLSYVEVVRSHLKNELDSLERPYMEEGKK